MRPAAMSRWVNVLVVLFLALVIPASAARAGTATPAAVAAPADFGNPFDGCKDAPMPSKPRSPVGLEPSVKRDGDPFWDKGVTIESVYGNGYSFFTYDNGCKPGSGVMPAISSEVGNIGLRTPAAMSSMGHGLQSAVISPGWLQEMDKVVVEATDAARESVWVPWAGTAILLVGVLMMWLSRTGRLDATITTGAWALIVLTLVTFLGNYPKEATGLVDDTVRAAAVTVADTSTGEDSSSVQGQDRAQVALERQWDEISRVTSYRTWAEGTFGDAESATAKKFGPRTFKATHLSWSEYDKVNTDPEGEGKKVLERKEREFKAVAEDVAEADPFAYQYFTGNEWGQRASMSVLGVVAALCSMLLVMLASIGMAIGLIIFRVFVVFSPALGVIFLLEPTREWALGLVSKVAKWIVLGPILLFAGLVVLRMNAAITGADAPLWLRLLGTALVSLTAWLLVRPMGGVPRLHLGRKAMGMMKMAVLGVTAGAAGAAASTAKNPDDERQQDSHDGGVPQRFRRAGDAPVALPPAREFQSLPSGAPSVEEPQDLGEVRAAPVRLRPDTSRGVPADHRSLREISALPAGTTADRLGGRSVSETERGLPAGQSTLTPPASQVGDEGQQNLPPRGVYLSDEPTAAGLLDGEASSAGTSTSAAGVVGTYHAVGRVSEEPIHPTPGQDAGTVDEGSQSTGSVDLSRDPGTRPSVDPAPASDETVVVEPAQSSAGPTPVSGQVLGAEDELPTHISEANVTYGEDGAPVYLLYRPEGSVTYRVE